MVATDLDSFRFRGRYSRRLDDPQAIREGRVLIAIAVALLATAFVLAGARSFLRALCCLRRSADLHTALVAVLALQRALWSAIAPGFCCGDSHSCVRGGSIERMEFAVA